MLTCSSSGYPAPVIVWYICPGIQKTYVVSWISSRQCHLLAPFSESFQWLSWIVAVQVRQSHHLRGSGRWHDLAARWRERYQTPQPVSITWWWCHSGMRGQQSRWRVSQSLPASYVPQEHNGGLFSASRISRHEKKIRLLCFAEERHIAFMPALIGAVSTASILFLLLLVVLYKWRQVWDQ